MEGMKQFPDKYFELAIVDPPYGIGESGGKRRFGPKSVAKGFHENNKYTKKSWDNKKPSKDYIEELIRISKNQIIWGANHFISNVPFDSPCWIVWHKKGADKSDFADCELAWTSFKSATRIFQYPWVGFGCINSGEIRIHPTQKPIKLYEWLISKYAKPGDKILDTHVGSASSLIACHNYGFEYIGFEIDKDYYEAATRRLEAVKAQVSMF
jgi:site-specific DNA-methyltransferase (adenine-specific)